jgi:hypothetical protein
MKRWLIAVATAFATAFAATAASAADMRVYADACNGGEKGCYFFVIEGPIEAHDGGKFLELVYTHAQEIDNAAVLLDSPGGSLVAALQIGRAIKKGHYATYVSEGSVCLSACALIFVAGSSLQVEATSKIGFHAAYYKSTGTETGAGNALIGAYLTNLGYKQDAVLFFTQAGPTQMNWLTAKAAEKLGMKIEVLGLDKNLKKRS